MKRLIACLAFLNIFFYCPHILSEESDKIFRTKYTNIHYAEDKDINDFIWHLSGKKSESPLDSKLASTYIDRIVERVEAILEMWPRNFSVAIYLKRENLEPKNIAFYDDKTRSIKVSIDQATDGVLAHEIAHAAIYQYFKLPPPRKIQEFLTQYVDKYLWSDY